MGQAQSDEEEDDEEGEYEEEEEMEVDRLANVSRTGVLRQINTPQQPSSDQHQAKPMMLNLLKQEIVDVELSSQTTFLHVYDVHSAVQMANDYLAFYLEEISVGGAFHAGIEVFGSEWAYGKSGVSGSVPRTVEGHIYRCSIFLGKTHLTPQEFAVELHELCQIWSGKDYDILGRNCCGFACDLCERLGVGPVPAWIDRFARMLHKGRTASRAASRAAKRLMSQVNHLGEFLDLKKHGKPVSPLVETDATEDVSSSLSVPDSPLQIRVRGEDVVFESAGDMNYPGAFPKPAPTPSSKPVYVSMALHSQDDDLWKLPPVPEGVGEEGRFPVGARVEYRSISHGLWVPAKVLAYHMYSGLYDLDVKLQALEERIRWPSDVVPKTGVLEAPPAPQGVNSVMGPDVGRKSQPNFTVGESVRYSSVSAGGWIVAKVVAFHADTNLYDLDCKPEVAPEKIRWRDPSDIAVIVPFELMAEQKEHIPSPSPVEATGRGVEDSAIFPINSNVEYNSSACGWMPAKVLVYYPDMGLYDLNCKQRVPPHKIRFPAPPEAPPAECPDEATESVCSDTSTIAGDLENSSLEVTFPVGATVEYKTVNAGWILAQVVAFCSVSGLYDLDCKQKVPLTRIRWPTEVMEPIRTKAEPQELADLVLEKASQKGSPTYSVGTRVEYESASLGMWIAGEVLAFHHETGLYDLDCKQQAQPHRIRLPGLCSLEEIPLPLQELPDPAAGHQTEDISRITMALQPPGPHLLPNNIAEAEAEVSADSADGTSLKEVQLMYPMGTAVEYESATVGWMKAKVVGFNQATGLYDLDCKQMVAPSRIRYRAFFAVGATVEYYSASFGTWFPAQVIGFHAESGLYDLDCKELAHPQNIR